MDQVENTIQFARSATSEELIPQFETVITELKTKFGSWQIPWEISVCIRRY